MTRDVPQLTLYYRIGCHLCEDMEEQLQELLGRHSYELIRLDIDEDPGLRERFNVKVPVLFLDDSELCEHFLDLEAVTEALASYNTPYTTANTHSS